MYVNQLKKINKITIEAPYAANVQVLQQAVIS